MLRLRTTHFLFNKDRKDSRLLYSPCKAIVLRGKPQLGFPGTHDQPPNHLPNTVINNHYGTDKISTRAEWLTIGGSFLHNLLGPARHVDLGALEVSGLHPLHTSWGKILCPPIGHQIKEAFLTTSIVLVVLTIAVRRSMVNLK